MLTTEKEKKLDEKLKELAATNYHEFCKITRVDKIQALVCIENKAGKTFGQIATILGITRQAVSIRCKKCQ